MPYEETMQYEDTMQRNDTMLMKGLYEIRRKYTQYEDNMQSKILYAKWRH